MRPKNKDAKYLKKCGLWDDLTESEQKKFNKKSELLREWMSIPENINDITDNSAIMLEVSERNMLYPYSKFPHSKEKIHSIYTPIKNLIQTFYCFL